MIDTTGTDWKKFNDENCVITMTFGEYKEDINKLLQDIQNEAFAVYDWGKNHGNPEMISRAQLVKIIEKFKK